MNSKLHIKKNDTVKVISGKSKGKKGKVLEVSPKEGKVIVEGVNMVTKHVKPKKQGQAGGILKAEGPLYACKVMLICPKCGKPTRIGHKIMEDGSKERVCRNADCRETI
jgi:large subunit ribosomal protein L24